ncbi:MAG: hypothetical protein LBL28_00640 [Treponema sp.]|jgi:hypothetical protein|nr:hypothetical protein [Treponema sp.]
MVKIPGADSAGPAGGREQAGSFQKKAAPGGGKISETGTINRPLPAHPVQNSVKSPVAASVRPQILPKTLSALARALGLPPDGLSASILSFARYFSLPLSPEVLGKIRRDSFSPASEEARQGQDPQAAALAATAAAAKGLELSREGLAACALFLSGHWPADPEGPEKNPAGPDQSGGGEDSPGDTGGGPSGGEAGGPGTEGQKNNGEPADLRGNPGAVGGGLDQPEVLREKVLEIEPPLLSLLNRIPGKDGERWIVLPFTFTRDAVEYRLVLRIRMDDPLSNSVPGGRLALDIAAGAQDKPAFRWLFMYDRPSGEAPRLKARFWPPERKKTLKSFQTDLSRLFMLHSKQIDLQNDEKIPVFAPDCRSGVLPSVNEEV